MISKRRKREAFFEYIKILLQDHFSSKGVLPSRFFLASLCTVVTITLETHVEIKTF